MQKHSCKKVIMCLLILVSVILTVAASSFAATTGSSRRTVRVGLPDTDIATATGDDNKNVSYDKEYLQAIAEYANWDYVYVPATWNQCLEMAKNEIGRAHV